MIHILFVSGSFGSMLEWGIRCYSSEYENPPMEVKSDGGMHKYRKIYHPCKYSELIDLNNITDPSYITTPIYPMTDCHSDRIVEFFNSPKFHNDKRILIGIPDINVAELVILMHYYKISVGLELTLDSIFNNDLAKKDITNWNLQYTHWNEMQRWELREWFSLFYSTWVDEWIDTKNYITDQWLVINPIDLVNNYDSTVKQAIEFCGLEYIKNAPATEISKLWCLKQQPYIDEYNNLDKIVDKTVENKLFKWKKLSIIHEAMIQKKLRDHGYELQCYNLNDFPCNSIDLYKLLDR